MDFRHAGLALAIALTAWMKSEMARLGKVVRAAGIRIDIVHVPCKGSNLAALDVVPGRVPLLTTVLVEAMPFVQAGKLRVIATASARRARGLIQINTVVGGDGLELAAGAHRGTSCPP